MIPCLLIGDSIALGVGNTLPECRTEARVEITSRQFVHQLSSLREADRVVISLGVNDGVSPQTIANLQRVRDSVRGSAVYWLLPRKSRIRTRRHPCGCRALRRSIDRLRAGGRARRAASDRGRISQTGRDDPRGRPPSLTAPVPAAATAANCREQQGIEHARHHHPGATRQGRACRGRPGHPRHQHPWRTGGRYLGVQPPRHDGIHVDGAQPRHAAPADPARRRCAADQSPAADPDRAGGHLGRHPRHADGRLRSLSLPGARLQGIPRQLHRQSGAGPGGARPDAAGDAEPAQPVHEHPVDGGGRAVIRAAGLHAQAATSGCAPRWTWSSRSPPVRRTSCRSTAAPGNRPRRISGSRPDDRFAALTHPTTQRMWRRPSRRTTT